MAPNQKGLAPGDDRHGGQRDADLDQGGGAGQPVMAFSCRALSRSLASRSFSASAASARALSWAAAFAPRCPCDNGLAAIVGGDVVHVPLQAVGLIFVPGVGGLVLGQHRLADSVMARPPSTVSRLPAAAAITARTATVMETLEIKGSRSWAACSACSACSWASSAGSCDHGGPPASDSASDPSGGRVPGQPARGRRPSPAIQA